MMPRLSNLSRFASHLSSTSGRQHTNYIRQLSTAHIEDKAASDLEPLFDTFKRRHNYLRISLTEKCNLRCKYCMPAEGVTLSKQDKILTSDEIVKLTEIFASLGVDKVRLTGGEPTVRRDLIDLLKRIKDVPGITRVGLTTNGLTLTRQLVALQNAGLDVVNVSLDTLQEDRYELITRRPGFRRVIAGIDLAVQLNYKPKINCVVMKNYNLGELCDFVEFTKDRNVDVRFIEFMPFTGNKWDDSSLVSYKQMLDTIRSRWPHFTPLDNEANDTSKAWKVPEYAGQVGFITSMTEHFCSSCNRMRLTADGNLKVCLFGAAEVSLRDPLRDGAGKEEIVEIIRSALVKKKKKHAESKQKATKSILNIPEYKLDFIPATFLKSTNYSQARLYSTDSGEHNSTFTHLDGRGRAKMVDVGEKDITKRSAIAAATVRVGSHICKMISEGNMKKGNVLSVAQLAGIMGAKKTPELIPLCHPLTLDSVNVTLTLGESDIEIRCEANCHGRTGVEIEALTGVTIAALTVYDMCKAVSKTISITNIQVLRKVGGKSDLNLKYNKEPIKEREVYAPINFMYL